MPQHPEPKQIDPTGPIGGGTFEYRGVKIHAQAKGYVSTLDWPEHPFHRSWKGKPGTWCGIIDAWLDAKRLPPWYIPPMV